MEHQKTNRRALVGLVLIIVGFLLVITHFGLLPSGWSHVIISWPALLILLGAVMLFSRHNYSTGAILIIVGGFFLLGRLWPLTFEMNRLFWPAVLLGLGSVMLIREVTKRRYNKDSGPDFIDIIDLFGGGDKKISSKNFQGGKVTAIFGGSKLDLRNAELAPGQNELDVFLMFGGIKLLVPSGWDVRIEVFSIFGGFSDKRNMGGNNVKESGKELVIKGLTLFGGGDLVSF
jgi:predicted membrane protein